MPVSQLLQSVQLFSVTQACFLKGPTQSDIGVSNIFLLNRERKTILPPWAKE
jgi:hypothetical protein